MGATLDDRLRAEEKRARAMDAQDDLASLRAEFSIPTGRDGKPVAYFAGNSLGLQPREAQRLVQEELEDWATLGVDGHFEARRPWFSYHELLRDPAARLVGADPREVVVMNSLTVNLHLMMASFYRPTQRRFRIVIEDSAFPSDSYAVASQAKYHGFDPDEAVIRLKPRSGEELIRTEDVERLLEREGDAIALLAISGVNYLTGQLMDMERITSAGRDAGCVVGWDLAHAAGNVPLRLHDWGADFAVWCSYKYLNAGPGSLAGCFVHERHWRGGAADLPRFEGWWGHDPDERFRMGKEFIPARGADAWQLSNPPIFSMAPVLASLKLFDRVGMDALRAKSLKLTAFLESLIDGLGERFRIITPREPEHRGCQLSIVAPADGRALQRRLRERDVVCDYREPNILRAAPVPMYNTFYDVWRLARALADSA